MGFLKVYYETAKKVLLRPAEFFREMPVDGGYKAALIFAIMTAVVMGIGLTAITLGVGFLAIVFAPIAVTISVFIAGGLLLLAARIMGGKASYEATVKIVCYTNVVNLVGWIPIVSIAGSIYGLWLTIVGMREVHKLSLGKAIAAVAITIAVVFIVVVILAIIGIGITGYVPGA